MKTDKRLSELTAIRVVQLVGLWVVRVSGLAAMAASFCASAMAQSQQQPSSSLAITEDLSIRDGLFLGLRLGTNLDQVKAAGTKYFVQKPAETYGPYFEVAQVPAEIKGTYRRSLYFNDEYGLYRAKYEISGGDGAKLTADTAQSVFNDVLRKLAQDNPSGRIVKKQVADVNTARFDVLQACPAGVPQIQSQMNKLSTDQVRELLVKLGSKIGETYSSTAIALMIHCGALPEPLFDIAISPEVRVLITVQYHEMLDKGPTVVVVFRNETITSMMKKSNP
jgi:hypothetical protein